MGIVNAQCYFGQFDGKELTVSQLLIANPNQDVSHLAYDEGVIVKHPNIKNEAYRIGGSSRTDFTGIPCGEPYSYILPGGITVYRNNRGSESIRHWRP